MTDTIRFSTVYDHIKRDLLERRDRVAYFVLDMLATHADEYGCCHPGVGRLADQTAYSDMTVNAALLRLERDYGYIRIDVTVNERRRYPQTDYQIGPHVMRIADESLLKARRLWNAPKSKTAISGSLDSKLQIDDSVTKESQQESEQESKQESGTRARTNNNNNTSPLTPPDAPKQRESVDKARKPQNAPETPESTAQSAKTASAAQAEAQTASADEEIPPSSAAPPTPTDAELAEAVERVTTKIPALAKKTARESILLYGVAKVDATLAHVLKHPNPNNAAGLFKWLLKNDIVQADDLPEPATEIDYELQRQMFEQFAWYRETPHNKALREQQQRGKNANR